MSLDHDRRTAHRKGLTLVEVLAIVVVVFILVVALAPIILSPDTPKSSALKEKGRGIWVGVISANAEREPLGKTSVWPKVQGFDRSKTSTEYFRFLMSDANGCLTTNMYQQIASDLSSHVLGGSGVPVALSPLQFTKTNNAWSVVCVGDDTPPESPFLITRNVDVGARANHTTVPKLTNILPFKKERAVWVTCGGACLDARPRYLTAERLFPATNETYDVMYP
jgi:competence protein ComGC